MTPATDERRAARFARSADRMREAVRGMMVGSPVEPTAPLASLNVWSADEFSVALFGAWTGVASVLAFYQDRIAEEGYLRTAQQPRSLFELSRAIGQDPPPATRATGWLAVTVTDAQGAPLEVTLPGGAAVLSAPEPGQAPTAFETDVPLVARCSLNALTAYRPPRVLVDSLVLGATSVRVQGVLSRVRSGQPLVIDAGSSTFVRVLTAVQLDPAIGGTWLRWAEPLDAAHADTVLTAFTLSAFTRSSGVFGARAPKWSALPDAVKAKYSLRAGGISVSAAGTGVWTPATQGLPAVDVRVLARSGATLFAGTSGGVFRSLDGRTWAPVNVGLARPDVHALSVDASGALLAGTVSGGVFRSIDHGATWEWLKGTVTVQRHNQLGASRPPPSTVRALIALEHRHSAVMLVATDGGVSRSTDRGSSWEWSNHGLPGYEAKSGTSSVTGFALLDDGHGHVYLGTSAGLFVSRDGGERWHHAGSDHLSSGSASDGWLARLVHWLLHWLGIGGHGAQASPASAPAPGSQTIGAVYDLVRLPENRHGVLIAATDAGIVRSRDRGRHWEVVEAGSADKGAATPRLTLVPGAVPAAACASTPSGVFRVTADGAESISNATGVTAVLATESSVYVATPPAGFTDAEWPGFALSGTELLFDREQDLVEPAGRLVIQQSALLSVAPYTAWTTRSVDAFQQQATVTAAQLAGPVPTGYDRRRTTIWSRPVSLAPFSTVVPDLTPIAGANLVLSGALTDLAPGMPLVLTRQAPSTTPAVARRGDPRLAVPRLRTDVGQQCEIAVVTSVTVAGDRLSTEVAMAAPLAYSYAPDGFSACGNVVRVTQGETVVDEVVGSGDSSKPNQRFSLIRSPLAVAAGDTVPRVDVRVVSPTPVRVGAVVDHPGVRWTQVPTLSASRPHDRHYTVRPSPDGRWTVSFGDGVQGARLPTGPNNVRATYRVGSGADGNVGANRLLLLRQRPPGILRVTNPLPATGGAAPAAISDARRLLAASLWDLGRAVAVNDFATLAARQPGIAHASADLLATPGPSVHVTVATVGTPVDEAGLLEDVRLALLAASRGDLPLIVAPCVPVPVQLSLRVLSGTLEPDALRSRILACLVERFGPTAWPIAKDLDVGQVVRAVQDLAGVVAVEVLAFHRPGSDEAVEARVRAVPASWDAGLRRATPAERVVLDSSPDILIVKA